MHFENLQHVAVKCDLCGGDPKCVKNCMAGALHYADINYLANMKRKKVDQSLVKTSPLHEGKYRL
jgi:Fe-S-cluster-containing hydrogenase component 2